MAMTDKATGIAFPTSHKGRQSEEEPKLSLFGVGVRKKGPIK